MLAVGGCVRGVGGWRDDDVALCTAVGPGGEVVRRPVRRLRRWGAHRVIGTDDNEPLYRDRVCGIKIGKAG
jgi:hypothetical protein